MRKIKAPGSISFPMDEDLTIRHILTSAFFKVHVQSLSIFINGLSFIEKLYYKPINCPMALMNFKRASLKLSWKLT